MAFNIRRITIRFALLMALAAVVPLVAYGFISILSLQRGTRDSVIAGNKNVVTRAAEEVRRYIVTNANLLKALSADLQNTGLDQRQKDQILKNYVLEFREYREVTLFDENGTPVVSSRVGKPKLAVPKDASRSITLDGIVMSPIRLDEDQLPTSTFLVRLTHLNEAAGWLAGGINLEEMWQMVDRIRIGDHGFAMIVAPGGELIAHGDPDKKALVARGDNMNDHPLVAAARGARDAVSAEYDNKLGAAIRIPELGWTVIVEQPASEAFANLSVLQRQLVVAISLALLAMIAVGYLFGRTFINPILVLKRGTQAVASGNLDNRLHIGSKAELDGAGQAFKPNAARAAD